MSAEAIIPRKNPNAMTNDDASPWLLNAKSAPARKARTMPIAATAARAVCLGLCAFEATKVSRPAARDAFAVISPLASGLVLFGGGLYLTSKA